MVPTLAKRHNSLPSVSDWKRSWSVRFNAGSEMEMMHSMRLLVYSE
jgi:hypothetical protein